MFDINGIKLHLFRKKIKDIPYKKLKNKQEIKFISILSNINFIDIGVKDNFEIKTEILIWANEFINIIGNILSIRKPYLNFNCKTNVNNKNNLTNIYSETIFVSNILSIILNLILKMVKKCVSKKTKKKELAKI